MAIKALTASSTFEHVSDLDPSKTKVWRDIDPNDPKKGQTEVEEIAEGATVFGLKTLDVFLMGYIYDNASTLSGRQGSDEVGIKTRVNQTNIDAVRFGLAYLKNFRDDSGHEVRVDHKKEFVNGREYQAADDDTIKRLGMRLISELAEAIKEASEVSKEDEKNSGTASLPSA